MKDNENHLTENQFLEYLADASGCPAQVRRHLEHCRTCRESIDAVEKELIALNQIASRCVPPFRHQPAPSNKPEKWRTFLSAKPIFAAMFLVVLVFTGWALVQNPGPGLQETRITAEMAQDQAFLSEIQVLEDLALSIPGIRFAEETDSGFSEEFLNYIAPLGTTDTGSSLLDGRYPNQLQPKESLT